MVKAKILKRYSKVLLYDFAFICLFRGGMNTISFHSRRDEREKGLLRKVQAGHTGICPGYTSFTPQLSAENGAPSKGQDCRDRPGRQPRSYPRARAAILCH